MDSAALVRHVLFRVNREYTLVPLDRLSDDEEQLLAGIRSDPDCYGILRPRNGSQLTVRAVSNDAARLLATLNRPAILPPDAAAQIGNQYETVVGSMIADSILEAEVGGEMSTGPAAYYSIFGAPKSYVPRGVLGRLSHRAIEYAATLEIPDIELLAARLYSYNRLPLSARWKQRLPDAKAVHSYLGLHDVRVVRLLDRDWFRIPADPTQSAWTSFRSLRHKPPVGEVYKVYVSVRCEALAEAIAAVLPILGEFAVFHWKVGSDAIGLLRPDKLVMHLCDAAALPALAAALREILAGFPAHGVPFTAELEPTGLLSWGADPSAEESRAYSWLAGESWRLRVCRRLAAALVAGKRTNALNVSPVTYALDRVRLDGVDADTWSPLT